MHIFISLDVYLVDHKVYFMETLYKVLCIVLLARGDACFSH